MHYRNGTCLTGSSFYLILLPFFDSVSADLAFHNVFFSEEKLYFQIARALQADVMSYYWSGCYSTWFIRDIAHVRKNKCFTVAPALGRWAEVIKSEYHETTNECNF